MSLKDCCPGTILLHKSDICAVIRKSESPERDLDGASVHADLISSYDAVRNSKVRKVDCCTPVALGLHLIVKELPPVEDVVLFPCPVGDISSKDNVLICIANDILLGFNCSVHGSLPWELGVKDKLGVIVHAMLIIFMFNNLAAPKLRDPVGLMVCHA